MQRHQARLAELGAPHSQDTRTHVHILPRQPQRFTDAYACDGQQPQQRMIRPRAQPTGRCELQGGFQPWLNLCVCIEGGACPLRAVREQTPRWNLRSCVGGTAVACEAPPRAQAPRPRRRPSRGGLLCSRPRQGRGDGSRSLLFQERDEVQEPNAGVVQRESHTTPQGQVLSHRFASGVHGTPPGHGAARVRNAARSPLAEMAVV